MHLRWLLDFISVAELGIGWLPTSLAQEDIKHERLALIGSESWQQRLAPKLF